MAAKEDNTELFAESSRGAVSVLTFFAFVLSALLFFGGMVVMGFAFGEMATQQATLTFISGFAATILGTFIAFSVVPAIES